MSASAAPKSGLQKEVLSLYRRYACFSPYYDSYHPYMLLRALRMVRTKPPPAQANFRLFMRYTFHKQATAVSYRDIGTVEYLIRMAKRMVEQYEQPGVKNCRVTEEMVDWEAEWRKYGPREKQ